MAEFINPQLLESVDVTEGVYMGSGSHHETPLPTPIPTPEPTPTPQEWNWNCQWTGHNSGGHSVCNVTGQHNGTRGGESLSLDFVTNFDIAEIKNASGLTIANVTTRSFTLIRNNHFNPTENIGFNFEIVTSEIMTDSNGAPYHGAIGENNAGSKYCRVVNCSES